MPACQFDNSYIKFVVVTLTNFLTRSKGEMLYSGPSSGDTAHHGGEGRQVSGSGPQL